MLDPAKGSKNQVLLEALERTCGPRSVEHWPNLVPASGRIQQVIREAYRGGIIYAENGWSGMAWKYDITSCYPSIAASDRLFPVGQPEFASVRGEVDLSKPAYYFCEVEGDHPLFRRSPQDQAWYCNVDIRVALDLGVSINIMETTPDDFDDAILFPDSAPGKEIFGEYVEKLFKLKQEGVPGAKLVLNKLFGLLGKKSYKIYGRGGDRSLKQCPFDNHTDMPPLPTESVWLGYDGDGGLKVTIHDLFSYPNLCALAPFITAYARETLIQLFLDHQCMDNVKRVQTDGFILDGSIEWRNVPGPQELGGMKLEYQGFLIVHHCNRVRDADDNKV